MRFEGKTTLVTGAASGIGRATALKFAKEGANVIVVDVDEVKLEKVKEELAEYGEKILVFNCDVSDEERVNEVCKVSLEKFGSVDILINNAALFHCWDSFMDVPVSDWKRYIDVNVMGVVYFTRALLGKMIEQNYGRIINIGSVAGVYGNGYMTHYSATKGAVISMTRGLAKEVADKGITVNCISPGSVSPASRCDEDGYIESDLAFMGRTGSHNENASLICFIASDEASYISGQNIQVDGCRKKQ